MANLVYDKIYTRGDFARNTSWAFLRDWDFSADKTITSLNANAAAVTTAAGCASLAAADRAPCQSPVVRLLAAHLALRHLDPRPQAQLRRSDGAVPVHQGAGRLS